MATAYTSLLGLALPVTGELQGTWGTTVNDEITSLLDTAIAGTTTLNTDADVTLSTTTGASNQARQAIILWTANGTVTRNITAPAQSKSYIVINNSAGTQSIVIRGAGPTAGVTIAKGERVVVAWSGTDFVRVSAYGGTGEFTTVDTTNLEVTNIRAKDGTASAAIADTTGAFSVSAAFAANGNSTLGDAVGDTVTVNGTTTFVNAAPTLTPLTASQAVFTNGSKTLVSNAITGSGNVVMSASPTLTGTITAAAANFSGAVALNGNSTLGDASADTVTVNGTSTFTAKPTVQLTSAATNTVTQALRLDSQSSGTPAAGIGVGLEFAAETAAGNTEVGATLEAITTDVTSTSEDFDLSVKLMIAGAAAAEVARFKSTGLSLATGDTYQINNTDVLSATTLGSGVTGSSLTSVGTIGAGTWQGAVINSTYGGTGINNGGRTLTINTNSGTLAFGAASKTLTINNSLTLAGTDATTMTFPAASTTVAGLGTTQTFTGINTFTPAARTSGVASYFTLTTPADTGQTASTESIGANFTAATRTWATGALTLQRERVFAAPTYAFAGASTLTTAVNVDIAAPVAGANATITNAYALRAAATQFTGAINATGLSVSQAIFTDANRNFVSNAITGSGNVVMSASPTLTGTITAAGATFSGAVTMSATTDNLALGTSQTSGTWTAGGAAQTGTITLDQSTKAHTLNIGTGATENATTKTINIGTAGVSGSTTTINIGSAVSGATNNVTINGNPTLSAGTANGVLYLNGSKVATSGSALTFDGNNMTQSGANAAVSLQVNTSNVAVSASNYSEIQLADIGTVRTYWRNLRDGSGATIFSGNDHIRYALAGTEQMRLTSTGLGIGTSSPGAKVDAAGNIRVSYAAAAANASLVVNNTSSTAASTSQIIATNDASRSLRIQYTASGGAGGAALSGGFTGEVAQIFTDNNYPISIGTNSIARLNIDTSGNLGLGVTPSAWDSASKAFQISSHAVFAAYTSGTNQQALLLNNAYLSATGYKYLNSNYATYYQQQASAGTHAWFTAPSGTAGNAISFTQAMTLDASGNWMAGTTTAIGRATVVGGSSQLALHDGNGSNTNYGLLNYGGTSGELTLNANSTSGNTLIRFLTSNGGSNAERARITSGGNLLVGFQSNASGDTNTPLQIDANATGSTLYTARFSNTSTSTSAYNVARWIQGASGSATGYVGTGGSAAGNAAFQNTFVVGTQSSHALVFNTADAERARITSGGDFVVARGTGGDTTVGVTAYSNGTITCARSSSINADLNLYVYSTGAAAARFYVGMAGTVYATSTTITAISDQRLKENIRDLDAGLTEVMALKPRKFDWKSGKGKNKKNDRGWIAQEFEQVFPDMVDTWADPAPEGEEPYKAVNADLIPVLVKAIQEQQALITALTARVAALEAQP